MQDMYMPKIGDDNQFGWYVKKLGPKLFEIYLENRSF